MSEDLYQEMRGLTREHSYWIWQMAKAGAPLEGEDAAHAQAMLDHPEYHDIWDRIPELGAEEILVDGANPFVHITTHVIIENQLADGEPSAVAHALRRLMRQGFSRHEAIHQIATVFVQELYEVMKDQRPYDEEGYSRAVRRLGRQSPRPATKAKGRKKRR
jgi:hypothetical protein